MLLFICTMCALSNICTMEVVNKRNESRISISALNVKGIHTSFAYVTDLMKSNDVIVVSEHWLPNQQLYKLKHINPDFNCCAKAGNQVDMFSSHAWGGVAILWHKKIDSCVKKVETNSNRICIMCISQNKRKDMYIIAVYLPQAGCNIDSFEDEMVMLEEYVLQYSSCGDIIIIGDTNCHFGDKIGSRGWGKSSKHGKMMLEMMERNGLISVDMGTLCKGPSYTYHQGEKSRSYIDHCIVNKSFCSRIIECEILPECIENTSDHLVVKVVIDMEGTMTTEDLYANIQRKDIAWHKVNGDDINTLYTKKLDECLKEKITNFNINLNDCDISVTKMGDIVKLLTDSMSQCSKCLPKKGYNKSLKPYWTKDLSILSKENKHISKLWKMAGCPRENDNELWQKYKLIKKTFRQRQRAAVIKYESEQMKRFIESQDIDCKYFWYLVNLSRKTKGKTIIPLQDENGVMITDTKKIKEMWRVYFEEMFNSSLSNHQNDDNWVQYIDRQVDIEFEKSKLHDSCVLKNKFNEFKI